MFVVSTVDSIITLSNLRISSFNCKNIQSSGLELESLLDSSDIVLLQETWLRDFELPQLGNLHCDFYAKGLSSMDSTEAVISGRPYGAIAILWRKQIAKFCNTMCRHIVLQVS